MPGAIIDDRLAGRNSFILAGAQAVAGAIPALVMAVGGLAGHYLLDADKSLATLPIAVFVLGTALGIYPAAFLMKSVGRRKGFILGALLGMGGGFVSCYSIVAESFTLFCLGTFLSGFSAAYTTQYRFAAADTASDTFRPKAISWVLTGGVLSAVVGPQTVIYTKDLLSPILFAGAFLGQAALAGVTAVILMFLKFPKISKTHAQKDGRPLLDIISQTKFIVAVTCAAASYALMSFVMTATPLAMIGCNHSQEDATLAIQWHVLGMYAPSFFSGHLIQRFGQETIMAVGFFLMASCSAVALMGIDVAHFWGALVLLGVGWNFAFIGATTMVTDCHGPAERAKVQATNDFIVFGTVVIASFSSGSVLSSYGWENLNLVMFPVVGLCVALLVWRRIHAKSLNAD